MRIKEGDQIGYITILCDTKKRKSRGEKIWMCKCICGAEFERSTDCITESIRANCNISCGCKRDKSVGQRELNNPIRIKKAKEGLKQVDGTTIASITRKKINKNNSSGVRGVCFKQREQKWKASIQIKGKQICKYFDKFEDAVMYRKYLEDEYFKPIIERSKELSMSNCKECRYYNDVTGMCYEMDKEVVNADAGYCIAHETSEAYDQGYNRGYDEGCEETHDLAYDEGFDAGYNKACSDFELEYYQGHTLGEAYEEGVSDTKKFVEERCVELGIDYTLIFTCNSVE